MPSPSEPPSEIEIESDITHVDGVEADSTDCLIFAEDSDSDSDLDGCEEVLGYRFRDREILRQALTHSSFAETRLRSNERMEFLGDAVLGVVISQAVFEACPEATEGEMTRLKSALVSRKTCAQVAERLSLCNHLRAGKGLDGPNGFPSSVKAAVVEALIAAVHLDGGFDAAAAMVRRTFAINIERQLARGSRPNFKSQLQQWCQREFSITPIYRVVDEQGPDHQKCFQISAVVGTRVFPPAWGNSKKEAEQRAAEAAMETLNSEADR